ncbi:uncharacterized membrane protein YhaH (DUF805 family) [Arthrobacter sp. CAN_A212]|uniref:DUF805 domain-containing protein n=1 Tax=Arthrobacter sp. CAN_A212 TaxID=2787719 RepID=UPI0018CA881B
MSYSPYPTAGLQSDHTEPPLWAPYYGASFKVAVQRFFKKYAMFSGRASRSEYWWWALVATLVGSLLNVLTNAGGGISPSNGEMTAAPAVITGYLLIAIWGLATIIPSIALTIRRLHDVNLSGWFLLLGLIPALGALALFVMMLLPPNPAGQRFDRPDDDVDRPTGY